MTTPQTRHVIHRRSHGLCEICGQPATNIHHRTPRGMGGTTRPIHTPDYLLHLCGTGTTGCHGYLETHRDTAYRNGWLLRRHQHPSTTPAWINGHQFVILTREGTYTPWGGTNTWPTAAATPDTDGAPCAPPF